MSSEVVMKALVDVSSLSMLYANHFGELRDHRGQVSTW